MQQSTLLLTASQLDGRGILGERLVKFCLTCGFPQNIYNYHSKNVKCSY
eukprot:XP_001705415.1 Hypothetical protein GL50803_7604 [Giardia lamblia ATCC 50803]